jgi:hypothetical protein
LASDNCQVCAIQGCKACNSTTCLGCAEGLFFNSTATECQPCFFGCRGCTSSKYDACSSCLEGFYWKPSFYGSPGYCLPCHPNCKTCTGPEANQCAELNPGKYWTDFGSPFNQTGSCDSSCGLCTDSPSKCTWCLPSDFSTLDEVLLDKSTNTCAPTSSLTTGLDNCIQAEKDAAGNLICSVCQIDQIWDVEKRECISPNFGTCFLGTIDPISRDARCLMCSPFDMPNAMNRETKSCEAIVEASHGPGWGFCTSSEMRSFYPYCLNCQDNDPSYRIDTETGRCSNAPKPHQIPGTFKGINIWLEPSPGCLEATFDQANQFNFFCTRCDSPAFTKVNPTDANCLNQQCASPYLGINKHCRASDPDCHTKLCIWTTPEYVVAGKYSFFELAFSGTQIEIRFKKDWDFFFKVEVKPFAVYEEISATQKKVFCRLISENLDDDQSLCTWISDNDYTKIVLDVSPEMYRKLIASTTTPFITLKKTALMIKRKWIVDAGVLNVDVLDASVFSPPVDFELAIKFNQKGLKDSNWIPVYQPYAVFNQKLSLKVTERDSRLNIVSYNWRCLKVVGDSTPTLRDSFNNTMQTFKNTAVDLDLTDSQLQGKTLVMLLEIKDEFYQEFYHLFNLQVVANPRALEPAVNEPVFYSDGNQAIFIPLVPNIQNIDPTLVTIVPTGLSGSMTSSLKKRQNLFLLELKVLNGNDFNITVTFQTYSPTIIPLIRIRNRIQSVILHEEAADTVTPFVVQVINRATSFKVYCADEATSTSCLTGSGTSTFPPGDQVTLNAPFTFTGGSTGDRLLFYISSIGSDTSVSSSKFTGIVGGSPVPLRTPDVASRATIIYPESPFFKENDAFYLDFKNGAVSNPTGNSKAYLDNNLVLQSVAVAYAVDSNSQYLLNQPAYIPSRKMVSSVTFTKDPTEIHTIVESRIISAAVSSTLALSQIADSGLTDVLLVSKSATRDTCNEPLAFFFTQFSFDSKFFVADIGQAFRFKLIPGIFTSSPTNIVAKTNTNCGQVASNTVAFQDTTNQAFAATLASYVTDMISSLGPSTREILNGLNIIMLNLWKGFQICNSNNVCVAPKESFIAQAASVLEQIPIVFEDNRYSMTARYSFINSFLIEEKFVTDPMAKTLVTALTNTTTYLKAKIGPLLTANQRFSRSLRLGLSNQNLVQPDLVELPIKMTTNMLNALLFTYSNDTDRNNLLNVTIIEMVNYAEIKQIRLSSHKKEETYEDDIAILQAVTVLTPLEPDHLD